MAVKTNPSLGDFKKYVGITKVQPLSVVAEVTDNYGTRIDFELLIVATKTKTKIQFYLKDEEKVSSTGKQQYISYTGRCTWAETKEDAEVSLDSTSVRLAKNGEEKLMKFLRAFSVAKKGEECILDHITKLINNGDVSEIEEILKSAPNNKVMVCLGLNSKGYQTVYTGEFAVGFSKDNSYLIQQIAKDTYTKDYMGNAPYEFREASEDELPQPDSETPNEDTNQPQIQPEIDYSMNTLGSMLPEEFPVGNGVNSDLPF